MKWNRTRSTSDTRALVGGDVRPEMTYARATCLAVAIVLIAFAALYSRNTLWGSAVGQVIEWVTGATLNRGYGTRIQYEWSNPKPEMLSSDGETLIIVNYGVRLGFGILYPWTVHRSQRMWIEDTSFETALSKRHTEPTLLQLAIPIFEQESKIRLLDGIEHGPVRETAWEWIGIALELVTIGCVCAGIYPNLRHWVIARRRI